MIEKIKKVIGAASEIETARDAIADAGREIAEIKSDIRKAEHEFIAKAQELASANSRAAMDGQACLAEIKRIGLEFQKELNELKVMKGQLKSEVIERVSEDMKRELGNYILGIRQNIDKLNEAAKEIKATSEGTQKAAQAMEQLRDISKCIKKEDFELTRYAEVIRRGDSEKLELLRKIDTLERLISRQRRNQFGHKNL